jgi:DNA replication protein DnaC
MTAARKALPELLTQITKKGLGFLAGLDLLLNLEAGSRLERRIERRIKESRLPERKTLDQFDFNFQPTLNKSQILSLAELSFVRDQLNLIITGESGTGKSHIAQSFALIACGKDIRTRYTTCPDMLNTLFASLADHSLERVLRRYTGPELLVIDDLGTEKVEIVHGQGASLFFKVINKRYGSRSTIITSNIDTDLWSAHFGDPNVTVSALDRFTQHAIPVVIDGPSYRVWMMEKRLEKAQALAGTRSKAKKKSGNRKGRPK